MAGVVDADTHVLEPASMWDLIDPEMYPRRPVMVSVPNDTLYKSTNAMWLIDGNIFPRPGGKGGFSIATPAAQERLATRRDISLGCRELTDPEGRLGDMDRDGVEIQVIYPTLFLIYITDDAALDVALARAYNRWMAQACSESEGRLRWSAVLPFRSIDESIKEMRSAKDHGAISVLFRGMEGDRSLAEPYFFPIYEEASHLDLPICVHVGSGSRSLSSVFDFHISGVFIPSAMLPVVAFRDIVANKVPELFPKLRFGFLEASASWVPLLLHRLKRQFGEGGGKWSQKLFSDYRLYVACEVDEDIPYLLNYIGEDHVIIGSDYAHVDPARESEMVQKMRGREDIPSRLAEKILCENPRSLYAL